MKLFYKILSSILSFIHQLFIFLLIIPFVTSNKKILTINLIIFASIYIGWVIFDNECWLSIVEEKIENMYKNSNKPITDFIQKLLPSIANQRSKRVRDIIFNIASYIAILLTTYKLNILYVGIIWIILYQVYLNLYNAGYKITVFKIQKLDEKNTDNNN